MTSSQTSLSLACVQARTATMTAMTAVALAACMLLTLTGCGESGKDAPAAASAASAASGSAAATDAMDVSVKPDMAANFKVAKVAREQVALVQEVSGRIEANERQVTRIGAGVTGRVTQVLAEVGDRVRPGQVLAHVASPELASASWPTCAPTLRPNWPSAPWSVPASSSRPM